MKKTNFALAKGLGVVLLCAGANIALAETVSVPASVTVNNAIDFTFTGTLDFGQVRATAAAAAAACTGLTMPADPALPLIAATPAACTTDEGALQAVGGTPTRPEFTIAGTAPFTTLTLTLPTASIALTAATGPGAPQFALTDFTAYKTSAATGNIALNDGTYGLGEGPIITNNTGGATFTVGATLATHAAAIAIPNTNYQDLDYTGTFDVMVNY
jgi:hypothetical protein